jgi:hypothetical protein
VRPSSSTSSVRNARLRRLGRVGLTTGTLLAAWVAAGAPIHLGMITDLIF